MAKYSEDFSVATWDKNGGSCSVTSNLVPAPDGNQTGDVITASTATPVLQQNVAGLVSGGTYTFYVWARVNTGTRKVSIAIVNNAYGAYLVGWRRRRTYELHRRRRNSRQLLVNGLPTICQG